MGKEINFERLNKLNIDDELNKIGDLYKFEDEAPKEVIEKVGNMTDLQSEMKDLLIEAQTMKNLYDKLEKENTDLKHQNSKLMYERITRTPEKSDQELAQEAQKRIDNKLQSIDIYED